MTTYQIFSLLAGLIWVVMHVSMLNSSYRRSIEREKLFDELDQQIEKLQAQLDKNLERLKKNDKKLN